jgi:hypothetical protein
MGYIGEGYMPGVLEHVGPGGWPGRDLRAVEVITGFTGAPTPMVRGGMGAVQFEKHSKTKCPPHPKRVCPPPPKCACPPPPKCVCPPPIKSPGYCVNERGVQIDCKSLGRPIKMHGMKVANMRGMRGLAEDMQVDSDQDLWTQLWNYVTSYVPVETFTVFKSIMDSSYENELNAARADMRKNQQILRNAKQYLDTTPPGTEHDRLQAWYNAAYAKQLTTESSVIEAIAQYNNAVWYIKSYPGVDSILELGTYLGWRNPQMLGMGVFPIAIVVVAAAAAIVSLCLAAPALMSQLNYAVLTLRADKAGLTELIKSPPTSIPGAGGLTNLFGGSSLTTYVLVGAAILFGYNYLKGKGGSAGVTT